MFLDQPLADAIERDVREGGSIVVPAHFEADAYAGLRRMASTGKIARAAVPVALDRLRLMAAQHIPLAPLLPAAYRLYDRVGAHDVFYVVLAQLRDAPLLTTDGPLARAATDLGVDVRYHETGA